MSNNRKLTPEIREKLRKLKRPRCHTCGSVRTYTNPLSRCYGCKFKFCFDHIWASQDFIGRTKRQWFMHFCDKCSVTFNPTPDLTVSSDVIKSNKYYLNSNVGYLKFETSRNKSFVKTD